MHADDTAHPLAPGRLLAGRYRVGERIGTGGSASVHRARDELLGRDVAIKAVRGASDPAAAERERAEVQLLARLNHRALVTVFDALSVPIDGAESILVVMELVDGPTLSQRRADGPLPDRELLRMARDLAEALAVVHAEGIVHRDVKPSNILLAPSPLPEHEHDARLADFGIAAIDGGGDLTATGAVLGTAAYLSPEQAVGGDVGPAADVYALGLVLLETITGEREFPGPALEALTARMLRDPVIPPTLDERWAWLLRGMTAREPSDRPSTDELRVLLADLEGTPLHVASPAGSDVATVALSAAPVAVAADEPERDVRTALLPAAGAAAADTATAPVAVAGVARDDDVEHLPARRRRRIAVIATVAVVLVAAAIGVGALAIQGMTDEDAAPATPSEEVDAPATPATTPAPTPSESATETSAPAPSEPAPQPTVPPTQEEPEPTTPVDPVPSEEPVPSDPAPTDPAPSEPAPSQPAPTP